jgi:hypothetical protein
MVRYQSAKHPSLGETPWALARPPRLGVLAFMPTYASSLRDERVNSSDGLVLWQTGARIAWNTSGALVARRLDGRRSFRIASGADAEPRFPSPGCWRLTLRSGTRSASVVARVISRPLSLGCGATRLESGSAFARPRSSGIEGGWPWQLSGPASLTTHGHDGDHNMKVPWWVDRNWGGVLELTGIRLDAQGSFMQQFTLAGGVSGDRAVFPSIVDVPAAGCWLLRLRTGRLAGVLVVRAVDAGG